MIIRTLIHFLLYNEAGAGAGAGCKLRWSLNKHL